MSASTSTRRCCAGRANASRVTRGSRSDRHDLDQPLPEDLGRFDVVVSSFAIHHLVPDRQRALYGEVFDRLRPGGLFVNVEHVASPTDALHTRSSPRSAGRRNRTTRRTSSFPSRRTCSWLDELGFRDVDCFWKWRELAVVGGYRPE